MPNNGDTHWRHVWDAHGVHLALLRNSRPLSLAEWQDLRPAAARVANALGMAEGATELSLSTSMLAGMNDYDASQLGLPRLMEAIVHLHAEGRVDSKHFRLTLTPEPLQYSHPWITYRRDGVRILVGERAWRLNPTQLEVMETFELLVAAGSDVAARLIFYPQLLRLLRAPRSARLLATGSFGHITVVPLAEAPAGHTLYTRDHGRLLPLADLPAAAWAMGPHRHYYLKRA